MVKRVFIIHGWGGNPKEPQLVWLQNELSKKGFSISAPQMPNTDEPTIEEWTSYLGKLVGKLDENTYFIGHSIGCQTIMRYLEKEDKQAGGCLFIAGWFNLADLEEEEKPIAEQWINTPINFERVKKNLSKLTVLLSSNEPYGYVEENKKTFEEKLGAKVIVLKDRGHFAPDDGTVEIPEALEEFLEIAK